MVRYFLLSSIFFVLVGCGTDAAWSGTQSGAGGKDTTTSVAVGGTAEAPKGGTSGNPSTGGKTTTEGLTEKGGNGATAGQGQAGLVGGAGAGVAGTAGTAGIASTRKFEPTVRNPKYTSIAPPVGEPLPSATPGTWNWIAIDGALSRDGSAAGFYYQYSKTGSKNLMIYLAGGGACFDAMTCQCNPYNKEVSMTCEDVGSCTPNVLSGPDKEPQDPTGSRWQTGIFKNDPANPVKDWNMVFVPYVTGDTYMGSRPNMPIEGLDPQQAVGHLNMLKFYERIIPTFKDAEFVLSAGTSAGGIGAWSNLAWLIDGFIDQKNGATVFLLNDSGPLFTDDYLEACLQKEFRDSWNINGSLMSDCADCVTSDGGGIADSLVAYLVDKFPNFKGAFVDSDQDDIFKLFYSEGLDNCSYLGNPVSGVLAYPQDRYPKGLKAMIDLFPSDRMSYYIWSGSYHQNLFETFKGDRFWEKNGLDKTIAEWLSNILDGKVERIGAI